MAQDIHFQVCICFIRIFYFFCSQNVITYTILYCLIYYITEIHYVFSLLSLHSTIALGPPCFYGCPLSHFVLLYLDFCIWVLFYILVCTLLVHILLTPFHSRALVSCLFLCLYLLCIVFICNYAWCIHPSMPSMALLGWSVANHGVYSIYYLLIYLSYILWVKLLVLNNIQLR